MKTFGGNYYLIEMKIDGENNMSFNEFLVYSIITFFMLVLTVFAFILTSIVTVLVGNYFIGILSQFNWFSNILTFIGG